MIVKYPVNVVSQSSAIEIAKNTAKSHGFTNFITLGVQRLAETEWLITLDVSK